MSQRAVLGIAVVCAVVGVATSAYLLTRDGGYSCDDAVPELDGDEISDDLPVFRQADELADIPEADEAGGDGLSAGGKADLLLDPGEPLSGPSLVALDMPSRWRLLGDDMYVANIGPRDVTSMHDGEGGQLLWARGREAFSAGGALVGDSVVLLQTDSDQPLSVAAVDPESGELLACTPVGTAEDGLASSTGATVFEEDRGGLGSRGPRSISLGDTVVIAQPREDDQPPMLYQVDPFPTDGEDAGSVKWDRPVDETSHVLELHASEDVIAFGGWSSTRRDRLTPRPDEGELERAQASGRLAVHAVDPDNGRALWSYPAGSDEATEDQLVPHTLVGVSDDVVVIAADRQVEGGAEGSEGDTVVTELIALEAATGEERWSTEVPLQVQEGLIEVELYDGIVVGEDQGADGAEPDDLVAFDAATGDELWRIPNDDDRPDLDGTSAAGRLFLPRSEPRGLEVIDMADGQSTTVLEGVAVLDVQGTDDTISVEVDIGDTVFPDVAFYRIE